MIRIGEAKPKHSKREREREVTSRQLNIRKEVEER
jgi:hypothetical protein